VSVPFLLPFFPLLFFSFLPPFSLCLHSYAVLIRFFSLLLPPLTQRRGSGEKEEKEEGFPSSFLFSFSPLPLIGLYPHPDFPSSLTERRKEGEHRVSEMGTSTFPFSFLLFCFFAQRLFSPPLPSAAGGRRTRKEKVPPFPPLFFFSAVFRFFFSFRGSDITTSFPSPPPSCPFPSPAAGLVLPPFSFPRVGKKKDQRDDGGRFLPPLPFFFYLPPPTEARCFFYASLFFLFGKRREIKRCQKIQ